MTRRDAALVTGFAAVAAATVAVVRSAPDLSLAGSGSMLAVEIAAAALAVIGAVVAGRPLIGVAACGWLAAEWSSPAAGALFTLGLVVAAAWPVALAAAAVGRHALLVRLGAANAVGVLGLASAVFFDPSAEGCAACPRNWLLVADAPGVVRELGHAGLALGVAWSVACCVVAASRAPLVVPAIALFGADAAHGLTRGFLGVDPTDRMLRTAQAVAFGLIVAGVAVERLGLRRTRARVAQLVLDIGAAPAPGRLQARLAESLGDPTLTLLHPVDGVWIDTAGSAVGLPDGPVTRLRAGGVDVLAVAHRPGLLDDPHLVDELATTARLAVEHDRLQAAHRARLEELRTSRERIVAAADRERRGLERDLHDGAQQRLVTLALAIRLARRSSDDARLGIAEERVRAAIRELREVAHGLFPSVLADEGLGAAIDVLTEHAPRLVARRLPGGRFPDAVESAAYFAAREALRLTEHEVTLDAVAEDGRLRLVIAADGALGPAITQIRDRVGAAGGTVDARAGELLVEMPCGS